MHVATWSKSRENSDPRVTLKFNSLGKASQLSDPTKLYKAQSA